MAEEPGLNPDDDPLECEATPAFGTSSVLIGEEERFSINIDYEAGRSAEGIPFTEDSAGFWFFGPDNVDVMVKVLNQCESFGRYWVFASAASDVDYEITVTDTETGQSRTISSTPGSPFAPIQDTSAFATCP